MLRTIALLLLPVSACAQFEVASVKPSGPIQSASSGMHTGKGRITANELTLKQYIMGAYGIGQNQIVGGPEWLATDRFDIVARAEQPVDDDFVLMGLLQKLIADRFKLASHRETRVMQAYVLTVGKNGLKLEKSPEGESTTTSGRGRIEVKATTLDAFAQRLGRQIDLPVVNRSDIPGIFSFTLEWSPDDSKPENGPSIFTAIQQLGLRLTTEKTPVNILVIDHAEKPSAN